jgi:hypothetical protein
MEDSDTLQVDLYLALAGIFAVLFLLAILLINPIGAKKEATILAPGSIIVEIRWPDNLSTDVDLWIKAPGEKPVGYSNKSAKVFNLLRDDLGTVRDLLQVNYENAFSRGIPGGEWVVNIHMYRNKENVWPIPVSVQVSIQTNNRLEVIYFTKAELSHDGEEITICRFRTTEKGKIIPNSLHHIPKQLRSQASSR